MDWNVLEKWIILDGQTIYSKPQPNTQSIARIFRCLTWALCLVSARDNVWVAIYDVILHEENA